MCYKEKYNMKIVKNKIHFELCKPRYTSDTKPLIKLYNNNPSTLISKNSRNESNLLSRNNKVSNNNKNTLNNNESKIES